MCKLPKQRCKQQGLRQASSRTPGQHCSCSCSWRSRSHRRSIEAASDDKDTLCLAKRMVIAALEQVIEVQAKQIANYVWPGAAPAARRPHFDWSCEAGPERGHYSSANYKTKLERLPWCSLRHPDATANYFRLCAISACPGWKMEVGVGVGVA